MSSSGSSVITFTELAAALKLSLRAGPERPNLRPFCGTSRDYRPWTELRWRLDVIVGLLSFIAVSVLALLLWVGGVEVLLYLGLFGLLLGLLVQGIRIIPLSEQDRQS